MENKKTIKINKEQFAKLESSINDCWICKKLFEEFVIDNPETQRKEYYLSVENWWDDGVEEHLKQIIGDFKEI